MIRPLSDQAVVDEDSDMQDTLDWAEEFSWDA